MSVRSSIGIFYQYVIINLNFSKIVFVNHEALTPNEGLTLSEYYNQIKLTIFQLFSSKD